MSDSYHFGEREVCVRAKGSHRVYRTMLGSLATMVCIADLKTVVRDSK